MRVVMTVALKALGSLIGLAMIGGTIYLFITFFPVGPLAALALGLIMGAGIMIIVFSLRFIEW